MRHHHKDPSFKERTMNAVTRMRLGESKNHGNISPTRRPFNIKEALEGRPIQTRQGLEAILQKERSINPRFPLLVLVKFPHADLVYTYNTMGWHSKEKRENDPLALFMIT